ncbi:MAG: prepilin-type N-terminal cleavage/methylation domain-containing protein [Candidatus Omnitrophota bacterium]
MKINKAVTLIEVLMVMAIIGVLAGAGSWIMAYTVKNSVFIPNQMGVDKLADDALDIMIEGDSQAHGLRFSRTITAISALRVDFINQDGQFVYYRWNNLTNKLFRSINGGVEVNMPAYSSAAGLTISGKLSSMFAYYDAAGAITVIPANVRRIEIILIAKSGTGLYNDWQGSSEQASSIAVDRLQ